MQIKKIIAGVAAVGLLTAITANAFASQPGAYVGGQLGYGNVHAGSDSADRFKNVKVRKQAYPSDANGLAGRLYAGYQFTNNFAGELGYSKFHQAEGSTSYSFFSNVFKVKESVDVNTNAFDLVAKASYPIAENVNLYGKLGGAYVYQTTTARQSVTGPGNPAPVKEEKSAKRILPTVSVGVSYDISPNVAADVSYTRIQKVGDTHINSIDFLGAGLTYNFG